jgi:hypothetical protein
MARWCLALGFLLTLGLLPGWTQTENKSAREKPAPSWSVLSAWGVRLVPIPDVLYSHLPDLKHAQGVVIDQLKPNSPAALTKLQLHDILLSCNGEPIRDSEHFSKLLQSAKVNQKVPMVLVRGGKEKKLEVILLPEKSDLKEGKDSPKGSSKSQGPAAIDVVATSLGGGKLQVTFDYYLEGNGGKLHTLECSGTLKQIEDRDVPRLPSRLQGLARAALKQIRDLNFK